MPCNVSTTVNGASVVCDNAGTSTHAGNHSGLLSTAISVFGFNWPTTARIFWNANTAGRIKQKVAVVGESDFA